MNGAAQKEVRRSTRALASAATGVPARQSMCGAFAPCGKVADRRARSPWPERNAEWRHLACAQADDGSRMEQPFEPERCHSRIDIEWTTDPDAPRLKARLLLVRLHVVPSGLRPEQVGREARQLSDHRLHGERANLSWSAYGINARCLASRTETRKLKTVAPWRDEAPADCPATGQSGRAEKANPATLSRHGTKPPIFARSIVPQRDTYLDSHL